MALKSGTRLGPYEIVAQIGAGGMGEVYRARDSRIARDVAIKILPPSYAMDAERLRRFEQEAQATGALNHPNILAIYDVGKEDGHSYLVSELLEGETLRDKLRPGPLPQRKAIEYAIQVAHALAAAHDKSIIHRDLKPENLFITRDGRIKILDFGLAKVLQPTLEADSDSETETRKSTPGMVLGTMGYMSPEQVRGKAADHRSDIFTFGAILFEMLTGKRAFHGDTSADTMSAILHKDPPELNESNPDLPPAINRIIRHCLEKNPEERFQSAQDVSFYLQALSGLSLSSHPQALAPRSHRLSVKSLGIVTIILGILAAFFGYRYFQSRTHVEKPIWFSITAPDLASQNMMEFALSPQGDRLAYVGSDAQGKGVLWLRSLDSLTPKLLTGTTDAQYPFWSPDGRFLAFFAEGKLKKIDISGEAVQTITDAPTGRGGSWNQDGLILFAPNKYGALFQVSSQGGTSTRVTEDHSKDSISHRWPQFAPDGKHFLYVVEPKVEDETSGVHLRVLGSDQSVIVARAASNAAFLDPQTILYVLDGKLVKQKIDLKGMRDFGDPVVVTQDRVANDYPRCFSSFSVSGNGALAYQADSALPSALLWLDRSGKKVGAVGEPGFYTSPRLSPDGKQLALINHGTHTMKGDIWLYDLTRSTMTRFTFTNGIYAKPVWFPDASRIAYSTHDLFLKSSNGGTPEQLLLQSGPGAWAASVSPDNQKILFELDQQTTQFDLWILPLSGDRKPYPYLQTPYNEVWGQFSPDGKWVAYYSDESGKFEVYIRPFPDSGAGKWQVSTAGGTIPRWRQDGKELYYIAENGDLDAVPILSGSTFSYGAPIPLFRLPSSSYVDDTIYDVSPDGQRFLVSTPQGEVPPSSIRMVLNWQPDTH